MAKKKKHMLTEVGISVSDAIDLTATIIRGYVEQLIRTGAVDPKGKGTRQILSEVARLVRPQLQTGKMNLTVDHTHTVLREARRYGRREKLELACLLYATWLEHWVNGVMADLVRRKGFSNDEVTSMIRDVPLKGKTTWLFRLLGFSPIPQKHVQRIVKIHEIRNSFVHYKWKITSLASDGTRKQIQHLERAIAEVEETIIYLRSRESTFLFQGSKKLISSTTVLRRFIRANMAAAEKEHPDNVKMGRRSR